MHFKVKANSSVKTGCSNQAVGYSPKDGGSTAQPVELNKKMKTKGTLLDMVTL